MGLRDIEIKPSYESNIDDIINDFYIPTLSKAISYDRIAGFFTSSSLAISCKGILQLVENGGSIRLLVSPRLNKQDIEIINDSINNPEKYINEKLVTQLENEEIEIVDNYRLLLAHLIAKGLAEIKLVIVKRNNKYLSFEEIENMAIFHQKIGIIKDNNDDIITFSGSINESFNAWNDNIEEFKTFKSWEDKINNYCGLDCAKFEAYWKNQRPGVEVVELPEAIRNKFITLSKTSDFDEIKKRVKERQHIVVANKLEESLFWYQKEAISKWEENDRKIMLAMATGTGKTRTAIAAINRIIQKEKILVIIATPQSTLNRQWHKEIINLGIKFDKCLICDSSNNYKENLDETISKLNLSVINNAILITTHVTSSKESFTKKIEQLKLNKTKILFVGDEVHGLGSNKNQRGLRNTYTYRLGLSATPSRWFDEEGTDFLLDYFGNDTYEFGIEKALYETNPITMQSFLTPYYYYSNFVYLSPEEELEYSILTEKINQLIFSKDDEIKEIAKSLLMKRANIVKSADNKVAMLDNILKEIKKNKRLENTLVFTSPEQLNEVLELLYKLGIIAAPLTDKQSNKISHQFGGKSERQMIIDEFKNGTIQVIVAIKCMDEGIDIPSADTAILMSSTTNPREYIQRIGRVIRRYKGKHSATIIDMIVKSENPETDKKILSNELKRTEYIVQYAMNSIDELKKIYT